MVELHDQDAEFVQKRDATVVEVLPQAETYEEFLSLMKQRGYTHNVGGFYCLNNFHQYFEREGPFWAALLSIQMKGATAEIKTITRDNLRTTIQLLVDAGTLKKDDTTDKRLLALRVVEEQKAQDPELQSVSWEECHERAKHRETVVANLMYRCMKILMQKHGLTYTDIEG